MSSTQRALLNLVAVVSVLVAAFGALRFAIEVGVSSPYFVAQDALLVIGGLAAAVACRRKATQLAAAQAATARHAIAAGRFEAGRNVAKIAVIVSVVAALALVMVFLVLDAPGIGIGVAALFVAAVAAGVTGAAASMWRGGGPALRIDVDGIVHPWFDEIPWEYVHGLRLDERPVGRSSATWTLQLGVAHPDAFLARRPWILRLVSPRRDTFGARYGHVEIPLGLIDAEPRTVFAAAVALQQRAGTALMANWFPGVGDATVDHVRAAHASAQGRMQTTP